MGTTSLLVMITLGLDMCIGNLMPYKFIKFKVESGNLLGKYIKTLRLDRDDMSSNFDSFY